MIVPLVRVGKGGRGTIVALAGGRGFQDRVVSMGLHIGSAIEVLQSPGEGHGPVLLAVGETRLALGHGMADRVMVAVDSA